MRVEDFDSIDEHMLRSVGCMKWTPPDGWDPAQEFFGHWVAQMDFGTAPVVEEAVADLISHGCLGYLSPTLERRARDAFCHFVKRRYDWSVDADHVSLAASVLDGLRVVLSHLLAPEARVLVPTPAYMPFLTLPGLYSHRVIEIPSLHVDGTWRLDEDAIAHHARPGDLLIVCNPWNPVGRVLTRDELLRIGHIARDHEMLVFADEIHAPLTFANHRHLPFVSVDDSFAKFTITAHAASKGFNLAGLHCAQMVVSSPQLASRWNAVTPYLGHATAVGALAASVAYEQGEQWLDDTLAYIDATFDLMGHMIDNSSLSWTRPEGTYLAWIDGRTIDPFDPARLILERAGVMVNAGAPCGSTFDSFVRFNAASPRAVVERSLGRILNLAAR